MSKNTDHDKHIMGTGDIKALLVRFSVPAIIGMLVNALYNIVDRIYVGRIDPNNSDILTGVGLTLPISTIMLAFSLLVGIGTSARISIKLGEGKKDEAEQALGNALTLSIIIGTVLSITGIIFVDKILVLFGADQFTIGYAKEYITVIFMGAIFSIVSISLNHPIRGAGHSAMASITVLIGAVLNTILDPIFIFVFHMGVQGAAIATIISQAVSASWVVYFYYSKKSTLKIRLKNMRLRLNRVVEIVSIGMSPFAMQIAASLVMIVANRSLKFYGGNDAVGAMVVISSASTLILMPVIGMNQGAQPLIGYNYGAKNFNRVVKTLKYGVIAASVISILGFIAVEAAPELIIKAFNDNKNLIRVGTTGIRIYLCMLPVLGAQILCTNYFQSIGKATISMFLSLLRQVILLIPLYIILPLIWGVNGIWFAGPIADLSSFVITLLFIRKEMRNIRQGTVLCPTTGGGL